MKLEELKVLRKKANLTRDELAELSGVSKQCVLALENGVTNVAEVKLSTLIKLATALKVKVRRLLPDELKKKI